MSRRSKLWIFTASGLLCAQAAASLVLPQGFVLIALSDLTQLLLLLSGTMALLLVAWSSHGRARMFWAMMTMGLAFWLAYQGLWCYFEVFLRRDVPTPFAGDVVIFLHLVPMTAALAMQPQVEQDSRTTRLGSLDFAMLLVWWLYLYVVTVIPWQYVYGDDTRYQHNLNILYLIEKIVFLGGLAVLWARSGHSWRTIYASWFGCTLTYSLSSYLANWAIERRVYFSGSVYDVPLAASMAWVTWIGLEALESAPQQKPSGSSNGHGVWVARLGMITVSSLPLLAAWSVFDVTTPQRVRMFRLFVTLASMLALGSMVFLKQHLLDRELLHLLGASQQSFHDLRRVQAQLVQSEKLASLGQLVGGAAHELNNPLTAMLGYSELLTATPLNGEQRTLAQKIEHQIRRTRTLVSSLLSFAKQVPADKTSLDINAMVQTAVKLYPPQLRTANVQVHTDLASDLPRVLGDSNQLLQVCLHITNNALHAMAETGGSLTVSTRASNGMVVIEFVDNGPGLQEPDRVFDPFYTTRPVGQGAGLGLSVCYGIIQEHQGTILCQNRPEGGAGFRIELPVVTRGDSSPSPALLPARTQVRTAGAS
ncbi:MAG: HAMP domain-containing sensor histidine kinase [Terriglobales bacterium]|jgi:signal transduction histidine kinase